MRREFKRADRRVGRKRINGEIIASKVRLVDDEGNQLGIVDLAIALQRARVKNLDLVEIGKEHNPPVCRIMDYGKFQYKKKKSQKKKVEVTSIKEIKFRPKIETHDYRFKLKNGQQFLENGHKLKISLIFRGRELQFKETGLDLFQKVLQDLEEFGQTTDEVKITGRVNSIVLSPKVQNKKTKKRNEGKD